MVVSAEEVQVGAGVKGHVYWRVETTSSNASKDRYQIIGTTTANKASRFYIRPDITSKSGQWFYITTEDGTEITADDNSQSDQAGSGDGVEGPTTSSIVQPIAEVVDPTSPSVSSSSSTVHPQTTSRQSSTSTTGGEEVESGPGGGSVVGGVERYVHAEQFIFGRSPLLEAHCITDKKKARFRLLDRIHHTAVPLTSSSWIPPMTQNNNVLPGDPYLIQPHCCSLWRSRRSLALHVRSDDKVQPFQFKSHANEPKLREHVMLFYLQKKKN